MWYICVARGFDRRVVDSIYVYYHSIQVNRRIGPSRSLDISLSGYEQSLNICLLVMYKIITTDIFFFFSSFSSPYFNPHIINGLPNSSRSSEFRLLTLIDCCCFFFVFFFFLFLFCLPLFIINTNLKKRGEKRRRKKEGNDEDPN